MKNIPTFKKELTQYENGSDDLIYIIFGIARRLLWLFKLFRG